MTPKEKAKELYYKFTYVAPLHSDNKECALIAIDLILEFEYGKDRKKYWQEVKQEIEKL